jgi:protoporphyrinogen oxidase
MATPPIVVLGAGIAGLATAWKLAQLGQGPVVVLERTALAGGLAGTAPFAGIRFDLGSHRVHPDYYAEALDLLRALLGDDLLRVPRHGRLRFNGRYIDYPPSLVDFLAALGPREMAHCAWTLAGARLAPPAGNGGRSYQDYLLPKVGRRAFDLFYAPYARKIFGLEPDRVAATAAKTRIATASPWTVAVQLMRRGLGRAARGDRFYFYPRHGFGSIGDGLAAAAVQAGVDVRTGVTVRALRGDGRRVAEVSIEQDGVASRLAARAVVSSVPLAVLTRLLDPTAPDTVCAAADGLRWRGIRLLQVVLARERCLDGETYYFPEERYCFGRISEPTLFSAALRDTPDRTGLNIEVICSPGDALWELPEEQFQARVFADIAALGLFRADEVLAARSVRLPAVYPVYDIEHHDRLAAVFAWLRGYDNLYSIGRGGQFLHANTDHSIHLGLRVAEHLAQPDARSGAFDGALPPGVTVRD